MKVIGIIGGVASGKSKVAAELERLGAFSINADGIVHDVLELPEIVKQMCARWGKTHPNIWHRTAGGLVSPVTRSVIADIVFNNPAELKFLETITWKPVDKAVKATLELYDHEYTTAVILDAPLLLEAGWDAFCDIVLFVDTPYEDRMLNFLKDDKRNPNKTAEDWEAREKRQISLEAKRNRADVVIPNRRPHWEDTQAAIERFWKTL